MKLQPERAERDLLAVLLGRAKGGCWKKSRDLRVRFVRLSFGWSRKNAGNVGKAAPQSSAIKEQQGIIGGMIF